MESHYLQNSPIYGIETPHPTTPLRCIFVHVLCWHSRNYQYQYLLNEISCFFREKKLRQIWPLLRNLTSCVSCALCVFHVLCQKILVFNTLIFCISHIRCLCVCISICVCMIVYLYFCTCVFVFVWKEFRLPACWPLMWTLARFVASGVWGKVCFELSGIRSKNRRKRLNISNDCIWTLKIKHN